MNKKVVEKAIKGYWNRRVITGKYKDFNNMLYHRIDALLLVLYYSSNEKSFKDICKENNIDYDELQELQKRFEK